MRDWPELAEAVAALGERDRVLEAGTGRGSLFAYLLRLLDSRRQRDPFRPLPQLVSVDIDPAAVAAALDRRLRFPVQTACAVKVVEADLCSYVGKPGPRFNLLCASAFLSAVPRAGEPGLDRVLESFREALVPGGRLLIEDYLPLRPARPSTAPPDAAELAQMLWRLDKAIAELSGRRHHQEWPPAWLAGRLEATGFSSVNWVADERQHPRSDETLAELLESATPVRPQACDPALWLALDRHRRDLLSQIAAHGLVQWSGSYRLSAVRR